MRIKVKVVPSRTNYTHLLDLEDLGYTEEQWVKLSEEEKINTLNNHMFEHSYQPSWEVVEFVEKFGGK